MTKPKRQYIWLIQRNSNDYIERNGYIGVAETGEKVREWAIIQGRMMRDPDDAWRTATVARLGVAAEGVVRGLWLGGSCHGDVHSIPGIDKEQLNDRR